MIEFNLIPDVKKQFIEFQRYARRINLYMLVAVVAALFLVFVMFGLVTAQKSSSNNLDKDVTTYKTNLSKVADIDKILTVQNQLKTLPSLYAEKPAAERLFDFLPQLTPTSASISQLTINYDLYSVKIIGTATSLEVVNKFVDTLKFTTYTTDKSKTAANAFDTVVLTGFGRDDKGATYTIDIKYDPTLFDNSVTVSLAVPQNYTTTRSFTESPSATLFNKSGSN